MPRYTPGWITVPGKGKRWRTADGVYKMQRPAGEVWHGSPGQFADRPQLQNAVDALRRAGASPVGFAYGNPNDIRLVQRFYGNPRNAGVANQYDLSTNLFLRYLSGAGAQGLRLSRNQGLKINDAIDSMRGQLTGSDRSRVLQMIKRNYGAGHVDRINRGDVPVYPYGAVADSPAQRPGVLPMERGRQELRHSLGSFWSRPISGGGHEIQEKYDFLYSPTHNRLKDPEKERRRADAIRLTRTLNLGNLNPADIGRRIVMDGNGRPFSYGLRVDPAGNVEVLPQP